MCMRHDAEFFQPDDAGEAHEIQDRVFVSPPGIEIGWTKESNTLHE
jgi:hypothetical protein